MGTTALAEEVGASQEPQSEIPKKNLPAYPGTYHAKDDGGKVVEVDVVTYRFGNAKKLVLCVVDFGQSEEPVPVEETGLDFFFLVSRKGPIPVDLGPY